VYLELTDYIPTYAPNYYKLISSDKEIWREVTRDNGHIYSMFSIKPIGDPPVYRLMYRGKWLDELGLEIPRTIDDWENVFAAVKEKKGMYGFLLQPGGKDRLFAGAFDVPVGDGNLFLKDGKIMLGTIEPAYKDYLALMNRWFEKGYINPDFSSIKDTDRHKEFDRGNVFCLNDFSDATYTRSKAVGNDDVLPAPYPRVKLGDQLRHENWDQFPQNGMNTAISAKSDHQIEALRWCNFGFTDEGKMVYNYGPEGVAWTYVDGVPTFTDYMMKNPRYDIEAAIYIIKSHHGLRETIPGVLCNPQLLVYPESLSIRKMWDDDPNVDNSMILPPYSMGTEATNVASKIMTDVNTYCDEMILRFITGKEPLSNFDAYVNQVKSLGIDEVLKLNQEAYEEYMAQ
jgi:putative aldouronate transport system substrate-binding protein